MKVYEQLDEALKKKVKEGLRRELSEDENVLLAYLFGSAVEGKGWSESDVDVAVLLRDNSWEKMSELMDRIAKALGISTDRIDLVDLSRADDVLKYQIISKGLLLVDKGLEVEFVEGLYEDLFDTLIFLNFYAKNSLNSLRKEVLQRKLMSIDEEVSVLKRHVLSKDADHISKDEVAKRVLRDSLRVAIESAIDSCKHIVASRRLGIVREYKDFPLKLTDAGLMEKELADELADFAKLRNIVVHRYTELNYRLLYEKAKKFVEFAQKFRIQIMKLIEDEVRLGELEKRKRSFWD